MRGAVLLGQRSRNSSSRERWVTVIFTVAYAAYILARNEPDNLSGHRPVSYGGAGAPHKGAQGGRRGKCVGGTGGAGGYGTPLRPLRPPFDCAPLRPPPLGGAGGYTEGAPPCTLRPPCAPLHPLHHLRPPAPPPTPNLPAGARGGYGFPAPPTPPAPPCGVRLP